MAKIKCYAKINWALTVLGINQGYHMLDGVMENIDIYDIVDIDIIDKREITVEYDTVKVMQGDLCKKAAEAFFDYTKINKGARISVQKNIPMQAGLGGGSSDCACVLWHLNNCFSNIIPQKELFKIGASLGADVPFFLMGGCCRARGKGEVLNKIEKTSVQKMVLAKPFNKGVSTKEAFELCDKDKNRKHFDVDKLILGLKNNDLESICSCMINHLEKPSIQLLPEIQQIMDIFYKIGAKKAMMTGSGSSVIGIFEDESYDLSKLKNFWYKKVNTVDKSFEIL